VGKEAYQMLTLHWPDFISATKDHPHWPLVEQAALLLGRTGHALDLGCGGGRDTRYLLAEGWSVTAVDGEPAAIALLAALPQAHLRVVKSSFEDFVYEPERYDLVSAQYALPFLPKAQFAAVFTRIKQAITPGGVFAGQFFGIHDEWNRPDTHMTFLTHEQIDALLGDMQVHAMKEEDRLGATATGARKHWHVFHVIAQKGG
jgi:tellurite methyltransferase